MVHLLVRDDNNKWHELIITADAEIDYNVENPLFTEGESYTLDIDLPYENDKNKILRDPRTKWHGKLVLDSIVKTGYIYVTSKKRATVSVQFVEKRPSDIFDETYINTLSLPSYYTREDCQFTYGPDQSDSVAVPWYNRTDETEHTRSVLGSSVEGMPFLIKLVRRILEQLDFYVDLTEWNNSTFRYLISCNVLPWQWGLAGGYENALPNWTVREFLTQLGYILHGKFIIDDEHMSVTFKFDGSVQHNLPATKLEVFDDYEMTVEDVTDCKYDSAKNVRFADLEDDAAGKYYSCPDTIKNLVLKRSQTTLNLDLQHITHVNREQSYDAALSKRLMWSPQIERYFISLYYAYNPPSEGCYYSRFHVLNEFAPVIRNSSDEFEEVKIVPVSIDLSTGRIFRRVILDPKQNENAEDPTTEERYPQIENAFNNSVEAGGRVEYYNRIFVGFWFMYDGEHGEEWDSCDDGLYTNEEVPAVSRVHFTDSTGIKIFHAAYDLSLGDNLNITGDRKVEKIDPECLYKYSFLSHDIPDPSALFIIRGEKYVCKKLNIVFNANGMSERIEGEFYKVVS